MSTHRVTRLHIDPTVCDGKGFCAELLPELIGLDEWEFPVILTGGLSTDVPAELLPDAKRAVAACPVGAIRLSKATK
jgi:ferredoxin